MGIIELVQAGPGFGDATAAYDICLRRECMVWEFIKEVLGRNGWGEITVYFTGKHVRDEDRQVARGYKADVIDGDPWPEDVLNMKVQSAAAHGGWSLMNYVIYV